MFCGCRLEFLYWSDECVIYNALSGDTHLVEKAFGAMLQKFCYNRWSQAECKDFFSEQFNFVSASELDDGFKLFLSNCRDLNLLGFEENEFN
jgi:hypothetical protein